MTYTGASSAGWPARFIGTDLPNSATVLAGIVDGISGVQIGPGATQFARIPFSARIWARFPVKFWMAAFVAAYGSSVGRGASTLTDAVLMIDPPAFMCFRACFAMRNIAP